MIPSSAQILSHPLTYFNAFLLWLSIITFAIFAGADFGAGIWVLLTFGKRGDEEREMLEHQISPIWEANEVISVFLVVGLFSSFPTVFYTLMTALFFPISIFLLGFVLRGASFEYTHFRSVTNLSKVFERWNAVFGAVSLVAPFVAGAAAGAVSSGSIRYRGGPVQMATSGTVLGGFWRPWVSPYALACGFFAVGICAVLAATYTTVQNQRAGQYTYLRLYRMKALIAGGFTAIMGAVVAVLSSRWAPYIWHNLTTRGLAFALGAVVVGGITAALLFLGYFVLARAMVIFEVVLILGTWAIVQFPYMIVPDLTIVGFAAPPTTQLGITVTFVVGSFFIIPSYAWLLYLFQGPSREVMTSAEAYAMASNSPEASKALSWRHMLGIDILPPSVAGEVPHDEESKNPKHPAEDPEEEKRRHQRDKERSEHGGSIAADLPAPVRALADRVTRNTTEAATGDGKTTPPPLVYAGTLVWIVAPIVWERLQRQRARRRLRRNRDAALTPTDIP